MIDRKILKLKFKRGSWRFLNGIVRTNLQEDICFASSNLRLRGSRLLAKIKVIWNFENGNIRNAAEFQHGDFWCRRLRKDLYVFFVQEDVIILEPVFPKYSEEPKLLVTQSEVARCNVAARG